MIYCEKKDNYLDQNEECINCIFYKIEEDTCLYPDWYPGLKSGRNTDIGEQ